MSTRPSVARPRPSFEIRTALGALALALCALAGPVIVADSCDTTCNYCSDASPATSVPGALWDTLEPTDNGVLPGNRDTTHFDGVGSFEINPYWLSLDVEEGWIFAATSMRLQVWDARSNPGQPTRVFDQGFSSTGLDWSPDAHAFSILEDIDAPPGKSDRFAVAGVYGMGLAIYDATVRDSPSIKYQDVGNSRHADAVYAATIGGRDYAFVAAHQDGGVYAYDMTAAMALSGRCNEQSQSCPGVYKGQIGNRTRAYFLDGAGDFLVVSSRHNPKGFEIWNVANPAQPQLVMDALSSENVYGVAMWEENSSFYLALRTSNQGRIYDVGCIASGFCSLGSPLWSATINVPTDSKRPVTFTRSNGVPFVHFGAGSFCLSGDQNEWLLDVRDPANPVDITPQGTQVIGGQPVSYWGWYYRQNPGNGFNRVSPHMGKFGGEYFYRAGHAIFDIHRRTGGSPPVADFAWSPAQIYPNATVSFSDTSTGGATSWDWQFNPDGNPGSSSSQNPDVSFLTSGLKTVTLTAANAAGQDTVQQNLTVLDPAPVINGVGATPNPALVCQPITFTAQGVTGQPPLVYSWQVTQEGGGVAAVGGNVNPFVWTSTAGQTTGVDYTATVTVTNGAGVDVASSAPVALLALAPLPPNGGFAPTYDGQPTPPPTGTVQLHAGVAGATEWNWSFGDNPGGGPAGDGFEGWTSDPVNGPDPIHTYAIADVYDVQVKVRNCAEVERTSAVLTIDATNAEPLEASFQASLFCGGGLCFADVGQSVFFTDSSVGTPDFYDYDWNGDGSFEDEANTAPVTTHVYTASGTFHPRLRVRRNGASDVYEDHFPIVVGGGGEPMITVSGPSSAAAGHAVTFTASAIDCTANVNGWQWTAPGATGSSSTSQLTVAWDSPGSKTVTASNSSCGAASDSVNLTVTGSVTPILRDGFEGGDFAGWTTNVSDE